MNSTPLPYSNYDVEQDSSYEAFENAVGLLTNAVAYEVTGLAAFENAATTFPNDDLRVGDVGCFTGGTTARWWRLGQSFAAGRPIQVLGTDIHWQNIERAANTCRHLAEVQFRYMRVGGTIPRIAEQPYHLLFATFVLDTIPVFEDVTILCRNMVTALETNGELYLLRLHPAALRSNIPFREYRFQHRDQWQHGDPLVIELINEQQQVIQIHDWFWEPERIAEVFTSAGCTVTLIDLKLDPVSPMYQHLHQQITATGLSLELPEWSVPLYQIVRVRKR